VLRLIADWRADDAAWDLAETEGYSAWQPLLRRVEVAHVAEARRLHTYQDTEIARAVYLVTGKEDVGGRVLDLLDGWRAREPVAPELRAVNAELDALRERETEAA
jgi:hypothetical protein